MNTPPKLLYRTQVINKSGGATTSEPTANRAETGRVAKESKTRSRVLIYKLIGCIDYQDENGEPCKIRRKL